MQGVSLTHHRDDSTSQRSSNRHQVDVYLAWFAVCVVLGSASACTSSEPVVEDCYGLGCVQRTAPGASCATHARRDARLAAGRYHACAIHSSGAIVCWGLPLWLDQPDQFGQQPVMRFAPPLDGDVRMIVIPHTTLWAVDEHDVVRRLESYPTLEWLPDSIGEARRAKHGCITDIGPWCVTTSDGARHCILHAPAENNFRTESPGPVLAHLNSDRDCGWTPFGELMCHDFAVGQAIGLDPEVRRMTHGSIFRRNDPHLVQYDMFCAATETDVACGVFSRGGSWYGLDPMTYEGPPIADLGVSESLGCLLDATATVHCWDIERFRITPHNCNGSIWQCERQWATDILGPITPVELPGPARSLAVGHGYACALLDHERVACWGDNTNGTLNTGDREPYEGVHVFTLPEPDP